MVKFAAISKSMIPNVGHKVLDGRFGQRAAHSKRFNKFVGHKSVLQYIDCMFKGIGRCNC